MSVKSRGSNPRLSDTSLSALTMLLFAIRTMPAAAWSGPTPEPNTDIAQHRFHRVHVGVQFAAAEVVAVHPSQPEIRVGRGRIPATHAVGGRTGYRACRTRSDVQLPEIVDPGHRAAAVTDLDDVDNRHHDRVARRLGIAFDPVVGHDLDVALIDERALRRRAADVQGDHVPVADQPA